MVDVDTGKTYEVGELERKYKARFKGIYSTQEAADAEKQRLESIEDGNPAGPPLTSAEPRPWAILLAWS